MNITYQTFFQFIFLISLSIALIFFQSKYLILVDTPKHKDHKKPITHKVKPHQKAPQH